VSNAVRSNGSSHLYCTPDCAKKVKSSRPVSLRPRRKSRVQQTLARHQLRRTGKKAPSLLRRKPEKNSGPSARTKRAMPRGKNFSPSGAKSNTNRIKREDADTITLTRAWPLVERMQDQSNAPRKRHAVSPSPKIGANALDRSLRVLDIEFILSTKVSVLFSPSLDQIIPGLDQPRKQPLRPSRRQRSQRRGHDENMLAIAEAIISASGLKAEPL